MLAPQPHFNQVGSAHPTGSFGSCRQAFHREDRMASVGQVIVWIVIGLIGGTLAGFLIKGDRHGFGTMNNLGLGLLGAFTGGFLFRGLGLFEGLDRYSVSLRDIVSAIVGSLLVLALLWYWNRSKSFG
jgi:uncharacterized membrane protein YeaQ/YmgE (transglycosylase-associated protein family)